MSTATKTDLVDTPVLAARFPIRCPMPCICCSGPVEVDSPGNCHCIRCGATQRKMSNELERLKAVSSPERSDLFRAAAKLIPISQFKGRHWEELRGPAREELIKAVRSSIKSLKEKA